MKHIILTDAQYEMLRHAIKSADIDFGGPVNNEWTILCNEIAGAKDLPSKRFIVYAKLRVIQSNAFVGTHSAVIRADTLDQAKEIMINNWDGVGSTKLVITGGQEIGDTDIYVPIGRQQ